MTIARFIFSFIFIAIICTACENDGTRERGNGNIKTETRSVSTFTRVQIGGASKVFVSQGELTPVRIEGDENLLQYVEISQEGDRITIKDRQGINMQPTRELNIYLTAPTFRSIDVSGASDVTGQTKITGSETLDLTATGVGNISLEVEVPAVKAEISGTGSVSLKGRTRDLDIGLSGVGHARCYDLLAENTTVHISGVGSAEVFASVKLDASVSGAGTIHYKGNANSVTQHVSGVGSVSKE